MAAMLFHEIYSSYYLAVSSVLREAVQGGVSVGREGPFRVG